MVRYDFAFPLGAAAHGGLYVGRSREGVVKASGGVGNQASRCNERGCRELATVVMAARGSEDGRWHERAGAGRSCSRRGQAECEEVVAVKPWFSRELNIRTDLHSSHHDDRSKNKGRCFLPLSVRGRNKKDLPLINSSISRAKR